MGRLPRPRRLFRALNTAALLAVAAFSAWLMALPHADAAPTERSVYYAAAASVQAGTASSSGVSAGTASSGSAAPLSAASDRRTPMQRLVDPTWLAQTAARTGIPAQALQAYSGAAETIRRGQPGCRLGWNTLAAIGAVESNHGTHGGSILQPDGTATPGIIGPRLDGSAFAHVSDTDGGALDGDPGWDHAVGPLQFIPSTWRAYGVDGNGDGVADPQNIDDAALSAGYYLCAAGGDLTTPQGWTAAVRAYNQSDEYVASILDQANRYAATSR